MADKSPIEWTDATWNPIVGCDIVSPGCTNCYAMDMAARIEAMSAGLGRHTHYEGTTRRVKGKAVWTGRLALAPERIRSEPLRWKRPRMVFVNSMGDLFHEHVPDEWIDRVFAVMALTPQHTYQVLTKRSARMREYVNGLYERAMDGETNFARDVVGHCEGLNAIFGRTKWPFPNVWLGVSCERQQEADERIPDLLATPTAVRFVSAEPLLGPIDFTDVAGKVPEYGSTPAHGTDVLTPHNRILRPQIDWIIVGGESGPGARPMVLGWAKDIVRQCKTAGVPVFVKQLGAEPTNREGERCPHIKQKKGADVSEWPAELRVREWPHA
mgnify:CR=1 FL=1